MANLAGAAPAVSHERKSLLGRRPKKLVFEELSQEGMIQLAYEIVQCSMMDPGCRDRALKALQEVIR